MTSTTFTVWGLTATLAVERDDQFEAALATLWRHLDAVDAAANRFRSDSEVTRLNRASGQPLEVSATFEDVLAGALQCAEWTDGLCDPTVLAALVELGYDRDYDELRVTGAPARRAARPAPGVSAVVWDRARHRVALRDGAQVDFGASAKALVADRVADEVAPGGGVVVEIGGDVAVRGRGPDGPWTLGVTDSLVITGREERVSLSGGGIATSSNAARTWRAGGVVVNHVVDPRTGECADGPYATASVASSSCLRANALATAALLWG